MKWLADIAGGLVKPVADVFTKKEERKMASKSADAKIAIAKQRGEDQITLTDAEWEAKSIDANAGSLKDEYITLVITSPIIGMLIGGVWFAFTGDDRLMNGINIGIQNLKEIGVDFGDLMLPVVLAAVGLKVWRVK